MTTREIAPIVGKSKSTVALVVKNLGIGRKKQPRLGHAHPGNSCPELGGFGAYFDGLVISDGHLGSKGHSRYAFYSQSSVTHEWLCEIMRRFSAIGIESKIMEENRNPPRKNRCWHLRTLTYDAIFDFKKRWYVGDKKVVPKDLDLTNPCFLRNWIYGDGTLVGNTVLRLCTDSFEETDVDWLIDEMNDRLKVRFRKLFMGFSKTGKLKFRPALCIRDGLDKFYHHVGDPDITSFKYKWRIVR